MHYAAFFLGFSNLIRVILADQGRGSAPEVSPTVCNSEPTVTAATTTPAPTCNYAADPDGALGLCPNLANGGWCDCGSAGDFPVLLGSSICAYNSLPASTLSLSSTNCASSTTTIRSTITVAATTTAAAKRALPTYTAIPDRRRADRLRKRQGTVTFSNCDGSPGNTWQAAGFTTMKAVLQQAYDDAVTLATAAQDVAADNVGFTHYFGGPESGAQLTHFQQMMKGIVSGNNYYSIQFECQNTPTCSSKSVLVADATVGGPTDVKVIEVCSSFWTAASTKYLLYDSAHTTPNPPYRPNDATSQGWCRKSTANGDSNVSARTNQFFATAGHSVLHELTHVDSLAQQAGLSPDDDNRHGTLDVQKQCELAGARKFLQQYIAGNTDDTRPDYNAESYAAAATEIYFMSLCDFSQIRPVTS